jgi:hypothetical protein
MCICVHSLEMKYTKRSAIGCIFSVHLLEMKCTKPSYRCLHLRRNTSEKTLFIPTQGVNLIGQKNFPNLHLTDKTFFFWLTPWADDKFQTACNMYALRTYFYSIYKVAIFSFTICQICMASVSKMAFCWNYWQILTLFIQLAKP